MSTPKKKKPFYKRWVFIIPTIFALTIYFGMKAEEDSPTNTTASTSVSTTEPTLETRQETPPQLSEEETPTQITTTETTTTAAVTLVEETTEGNPSNPVELNTWAKSVVGLGPEQQYIDAASTGVAPTWVAFIQNVEIGKGNNLVITAQIDRSDKETAEKIGNFYKNSISFSKEPWTKDIDYVIIQNGAKEHIKQFRT